MTKMLGNRFFTPADIATELWLDASDAGTITESGGAVSQLDDKSGNARHATQGIGVDQPTTNASGINGKPSLSFFTGDELSSPVPSGTFPNGMTIFMVLTKLHYGGTNANHPFQRMLGSKASPFRGRWSDVSNGYWNHRYIGDGTNETSSWRVGNNFPPINTPLIHSIRFDDTNYTESTDGTDIATKVHGGTYGDNATTIVIGNSYNEYEMGEIIAVDGILSESDRQKLEGYLAHKWGIALASGHPYELSPPQ